MRIALGLAAAFIATGAAADPCKAIPDRGPTPAWIKPGATFSGRVVYTADGDGVCLGRGPDPRTWIEVRLADFFAPELHAPGGRGAKAMMERITRGREVTCTAERGRNGRAISHDRVIAVCRIGGESLGELMRQEGVREGGNGR